MIARLSSLSLTLLHAVQQLSETVRRFIQREEKLPQHLTQSVALEESPLPRCIRVGVALAGMLLMGFIVWAGFTHVEEVASAAGQVIPTSHVRTIQHLEGGIVKDIMVRDGDLVEKNQPLLKLDDTSAGADLGQIQAREQSLLLQAERLRRFTGSIQQKNALTPEESAILASMEEARESQRSVLRDQIAQKEKQLAGLTASREALEKNVALMQKEATIKGNLAAKGYGSQLMALTAERELNQIKGQYEEALSAQHQAEDAIREYSGRLESLNADLKKESMKNLGDVEAQLAEVRKNLQKLEGTNARTVIVSPVRGVVKGLSVNTIGAIAESGKVLMEIVPVDDSLLIEAMVQPSDVGHIRPGAAVKIRVSAFEFSRYGSVPGILENLSATTFPSQDGHSFYKARIRLSQSFVGPEHLHNLIVPGMTVQADIITGDRSLLQYLLKPVQVAIETAFHEH